MSNFPTQVLLAAGVASAAVGYAAYKSVLSADYSKKDTSSQSVLTGNLSADGQMETVTLRHPSGASVTLYKFGATLVSWKIHTGKEMLFLSKEAVYDGKKPIRGGIPLVFPQFGPGKLPNHGFARHSLWRIHRVENNVLVMTLTDTEATRKIWGNHKFRLLYTIVLGSTTLKTTLTVVNTSLNAFKFQALLHTYYQFPDIKEVRVNGLKGFSYKDKLSSSTVPIAETNEAIQFTEETDRIYTESPKKVVITGTGDEVASIDIEVSTEGNGCQFGTGENDVVVWNPYIAKSKRMGDFGDQEWKNMCCIEPGFVSRWNRLEANGGVEFVTGADSKSKLKNASHINKYHVFAITSRYDFNVMRGCCNLSII